MLATVLPGRITQSAARLTQEQEVTDSFPVRPLSFLFPTVNIKRLVKLANCEKETLSGQYFSKFLSYFASFQLYNARVSDFADIC